MAVGLGSMDMPIPQVAAWEWVNWKFPKAVHAGETIFARWILTQKRPPVHGSPTGIAVWHVDVMTADGAVCADGDVGATVFRRTAAHVEKPAEAPGRPRRRRRRGSGQGESAATPPAPAAAPAPAGADRPPAAERPAGGTGNPRRRRRKRGSGSSGNGNGGGDHAPIAGPAEPNPAPAPAVATPAVPAPPSVPKGRLSQVMRRLRGT